MEKDKSAMDVGSAIHRELLESGRCFNRHGKRGYLGSRKWARGPAVLSVEDALKKGLSPNAAIQDAAIKILLKNHAEFQKSRRLKTSNKFYKSKGWLSLRYQVLSERGAKCECCGATAKDGAKMQVDHIKPRSKYPELELEKSNLQVLCKACNTGKSNRHDDDWRPESSKPKRYLVKNSA